jgi:hypothetical protein
VGHSIPKVGQSTKQRMFSLLGVNFIVSIKFLFKVINHTLQVSVLLWFLPISSHFQMARQTQTREGFWKSTHFVHLLLLPSWPQWIHINPGLEAPLGFTLDLMNSLHNQGSGLLNHFTGLCLRLTLLYTLTWHNTSTLLPKPERHSFTPTGSY